MADLKDIAKAHKGAGTIHMPSGTIDNESDYNSKVIVEGVTKLSWSEVQAEMAKIAYIGKRQAAYPQLAEQLDMLFRDIAANKVSTDGELYKALAKVKSDSEKP